jgi:GTPase-activator protein for Ras-like GTPase/SH3 domain/Variant SH3 domain
MPPPRVLRSQKPQQNSALNLNATNQQQQQQQAGNVNNNDNDNNVERGQSSGNSGAAVQKVRALFNCDAETDSELSFRCGDIIDVLGKPHEEWWIGSIGSRSGLFPTNFVEVISVSSAPKVAPPVVPLPPPSASAGAADSNVNSNGSANVASVGSAGSAGSGGSRVVVSGGPPVPNRSGSVGAGMGAGRGLSAVAAAPTSAPSSAPALVPRRTASPAGGDRDFSPLAAMQLIDGNDDDDDHSSSGSGSGSEDVKILSAASSSSSSAAASANPLSRSMPSTSMRVVCEALFDCTGENDDELSFSIGDEIVIVDKPYGEWWLGESTRTKKRGLLPSNYVAEKKVRALSAAPVPAPARGPRGRGISSLRGIGRGGGARGAGGFGPRGGGGRGGSAIGPRGGRGSAIGRGGSMVRGRGGRGRGRMRVEVSGSMMSLEKVRAKFDFAAQNPDELEFKEGDVIDVLSKKHPEWWLGTLRGKQGIFPCSWVESLDSAPASGGRAVLPPQQQLQRAELQRTASTVLERAASLANVLSAPPPAAATASVAAAAASSQSVPLQSAPPKPPQTPKKPSKRGIFSKIKASSSSSSKKSKGAKSTSVHVPGLDADDLTQQDKLMRIVVSPDLAVTLSLCQTLEMREKDRVAMSLVHVFEINGTTPHLVKKMIEWEVNETHPQSSAAQNLFRGNSMATKVLTAYSLMVARDYLRKTLKPLIQSVAYSDNGWEINPTRLPAGQSLAENTQNLLAAAAMFLSKILRSAEQFPYPTRLVCKHLADVVGTKFADSVPAVIGGFFFLRFICPAIITPVEFGVWSDPLPPETKRPLVLISKTLQCLSNGVLFGAKESYMEPLNPFISEHQEQVREFFVALASPPPSPDGYADQYTHTVLKRDSDMFASLYAILADKVDRIRQLVESQHFGNIAQLNEVDELIAEVNSRAASELAQ